MEEEYVSLQEAAKLLGVDRVRMWRLAKRQQIETFVSDLDKRKRLFRRADVLALKEPRRPT